MTRWTEDASDQVADHTDAALGEIYDRDAWPEDDRPSASELAESFDDWAEEQFQREEQNREWWR